MCLIWIFKRLYFWTDIWIFKRLYFWTDIWISFLLILFFLFFFFLLPGFYRSNEMKYRNMFSAIASCVNLTSCFIVLFTFPKLQVSRISLSWISIQNWDFLRDSYELRILRIPSNFMKWSNQPITKFRQWNRFLEIVQRNQIWIHFSEFSSWKNHL